LQIVLVSKPNGATNMNRIIWIVGAVVIVLFILGFFGLR
jgi:hypothetical protein